MPRCLCNGRPWYDTILFVVTIAFGVLISSFICCLVQWGGSMIFASQDPESKAFVVFLTVIIAIINVGMLIWLIVGMVKEYAHEQQEEAAKNGNEGSSFSTKLSNARDSLQRWRFSRMTPEAQQRSIRGRTFDAANGNATENPVTIEMTDIYNGESTGEIKVDDQVLFMYENPTRRNRMEIIKKKMKLHV